MAIGIQSQSDIGFLSLFEHYASMEVGKHLKAPAFPIWVVCSESHFSVLFSLDKNSLSPSSRQPFDTYYYDGLANQLEEIRLTISPGEKRMTRAQLTFVQSVHITYKYYIYALDVYVCISVSVYVPLSVFSSWFYIFPFFVFFYFISSRFSMYTFWCYVLYALLLLPCWCHRQ